MRMSKHGDLILTEIESAAWPCERLISLAVRLTSVHVPPLGYRWRVRTVGDGLKFWNDPRGNHAPTME